MFLIFIIIITTLFLGSQNKVNEELKVAYINQKYPYFFISKNSQQKIIDDKSFNGFEYIILIEFVNHFKYKFTLSLYEKNNNYDVIIGGIIYSKNIESLFNNYSFLRYFEDSISVFCLKKNSFTIDDFKNTNNEQIGMLMYSYAYFLLRQYLPKTKIYAYEEDMIKDLIDEKIKFIVVDDTFLSIPKSYSSLMKNIGKIYSEYIGILISKSKPELINRFKDIISGINFMEVLKWLK